MSIEKKSLISTLKSAKKANVAKEEISFDHGRNTVKAQPVAKAAMKNTLAIKAAHKNSTAMKAAVKNSAAIKLAVKNSAAVKAAAKN